MAKKIKVREIPSKLKEVKPVAANSVSDLEDEVGHTEFIPSSENSFANPTPPVPVLHSQARPEQVAASEGVVEKPAGPREIERPISYATRKNVFYENGPAPAQERQVVYQDPMVAAAQRMARANKPTGTIPEQSIAPALAPGTLEARESERVRGALQADRDTQYKAGEENRGRRGERKRYAWEA